MGGGISARPKSIRSTDSRISDACVNFLSLSDRNSTFYVLYLRLFIFPSVLLFFTSTRTRNVSRTQIPSQLLKSHFQWTFLVCHNLQHAVGTISLSVFIDFTCQFWHHSQFVLRACNHIALSLFWVSIFILQSSAGSPIKRYKRALWGRCLVTNLNKQPKRPSEINLYPFELKTQFMFFRQRLTL